MSRSRESQGAAPADAVDREGVLSALESALGYSFRDRGLLADALRHSSFAHDLRRERARARSRAGESAPDALPPTSGAQSNERLEFLGDAVVGLVVAHAFYVAKPDWKEGELTRALHRLVDGRSLARLARSLDLGAALELGRTERASDGQDKRSILADAMEAVIGAIYLDGGLEAATAFVERVFAEDLRADAPTVGRDPKTELQERTMASRGEFPTYRLLVDTEIEGDDERFSVDVVLCGESLAEGVGRTKRAARARGGVPRARAIPG